MPPQLSSGAINKMLNYEDVPNAVLQILGYKNIEGNGSDRYRLLISDGVVWYPFVMLGTQLNHMASNKELERFAVVQIDKYVCNLIQGRRKILIILNLTVLTPGNEVNETIGNPVNSNTSSIANTNPTDSSATKNNSYREMSNDLLEMSNNQSYTYSRNDIEFDIGHTLSEAEQVFLERTLPNSFKCSLKVSGERQCENERRASEAGDGYKSDPNYLPWNDYFMSLCYLNSARSKDPNTKVGACIVDKDNRVVSIGYNGMPRGIKDEDLPWGKESEIRYETKYAYVCHAEMNAIINDRHSDFKDCRLYVTKFPCSECAKLIVQSGLKEVIYDEKKPEPDFEKIPGMRMFYLAGVCCKKFIPSIRQLCLNIVGDERNVTIIK